MAMFCCPPGLITTLCQFHDEEVLGRFQLGDIMRLWRCLRRVSSGHREIAFSPVILLRKLSLKVALIIWPVHLSCACLKTVC